MEETEIGLKATLDVNRVERWNVFRRLQELSVPCHCASGQPLQVYADTATAVIQIWSVIQQCTSPRSTAVERLERCLQQTVQL